MNPVQETVLLYYPKKPKYLPKIKSIFVQLGIQFRILDAASTAQKIGYLTGRTGFEKSTSDVPFSKIPQSVLVMDHFSGVRMDVLFSYLKKAGIPSIDLKAIVTDTNADWTFFALYQEIAKEHARMHARRAIVTRIEESDFGCEGRPDGVIAMDHVYLRYEQESEKFCLMAEDDQLYADHIDENSTVLVTADGKILPL